MCPTNVQCKHTWVAILFLGLDACDFNACFTIFFLNMKFVHIILSSCRKANGRLVWLCLFLRVFLPFFSTFLYLLLLAFCLHYVFNTEVLNVQECVFCSLTFFCSSSLSFFAWCFFPSFFCGEDFQALLKYFNVFLWAAFISALLASGALTEHSFSKIFSSFFNNRL